MTSCVRHSENYVFLFNHLYHRDPTLCMVHGWLRQDTLVDRNIVALCEVYSLQDLEKSMVAKVVFLTPLHIPSPEISLNTSERFFLYSLHCPFDVYLLMLMFAVCLRRGGYGEE